MDPRARAALDAAGYAGPGSPAQRVTDEQLRCADLVVALDRGHRAELVRRAPGREVTVLRWWSGGVDLDVPDPYYGDEEEFASCLALIVPGCEALARALVREPTVFLLDEPLSNLDAKLRTSARNELKLFQGKIGTTTIYVTHDQVEAMGMGDRIAVLEKGRLRQVGTPMEIYEQPANTFVATFLGAPPMNLLERNGRIEGFRPENFIHRDLQHSESAIEYAFRVHRMEYLGSERILYGSIDGFNHGVEYTAKFSAHESAPPVRIGEATPFTVSRGDLRYFATATGERLPA